MIKTKDQKIVETMPWYGKAKLVEELSYGNVAVFLDVFPVTDGHLLFVPINPESDVEYCLNRAWKIGNEKVATRKWQGFNIGMNCGEVAGQTIDWPHVHLIPRTKDDCNDPAGGVRGVIPRLQNWRTAAKYKVQRNKLGLN